MSMPIKLLKKINYEIILFVQWLRNTQRFPFPLDSFLEIEFQIQLQFAVARALLAMYYIAQGQAAQCSPFSFTQNRFQC